MWPATGSASSNLAAFARPGRGLGPGLRRGILAERYAARPTSTMGSQRWPPWKRTTRGSREIFFLLALAHGLAYRELAGQRGLGSVRTRSFAGFERRNVSFGVRPGADLWTLTACDPCRAEGQIALTSSHSTLTFFRAYPISFK